MRTSLIVYFMVLAGLFLTSCSNDDGLNVGAEPKDVQGKTYVNFELDASSLGYLVQAKATNQFSPSNTYTKDAFSIYAFRIKDENSTDYVFEKMINLANLSYSAATKKLTGTDLLPIGTYKFLPVYGISNQASLLTTPTWADKVLNDSYTIQYAGGNGLSEIFLPVTIGSTGALTSYDMGLTNETNPTVTATLQRAVSRVDLMFIKAKKQEDGTYVETVYPDGKNVFGNAGIEKIEMRYEGLNNTMSYFGSNLTTDRFDKTIELALNNKILIGGSANASTIGQGATFDYDNINSDQLIYGAAHVFGNYLLPNNNADKTTSLEIYIKPANGIGRTIDVSLTDDKKLPLERNKVTLVKIYVLDDTDPEDPEKPEPPTVFTTKVKFEVEIETKWDGSHEVTGELE